MRKWITIAILAVLAALIFLAVFMETDGDPLDYYDSTAYSDCEAPPFELPENLAEASPEALLSCSATYAALSTNHYFAECDSMGEIDCQSMPTYVEAEATSTAYFLAAETRNAQTKNEALDFTLAQMRATHNANGLSVIGNGGDAGQAKLQRLANICKQELPIAPPSSNCPLSASKTGAAIDTEQ